MKDPAALWSKIGVLINQPKATSDCKFSPDEFADFFQNKVSKIRLFTSSANPPVIDPRQYPALSSFRPVTAEQRRSQVLTPGGANTHEKGPT